MKLRTSIRTIGVLLGLLISIGLESSRIAAFASGTPAEGEGIWLDALGKAVVLGFPVNGFVAMFIEPITAISMAIGVDPYYALLLGVVVNWTMIAWFLKKFLDRKQGVKPQDQ